MWQRHVMHLVVLCLVSIPGTNMKSENIIKNMCNFFGFSWRFWNFKHNSEKTNPKQIIVFLERKRKTIPLTRNVGSQPFTRFPTNVTEDKLDFELDIVSVSIVSVSTVSVSLPVVVFQVVWEVVQQQPLLLSLLHVLWNVVWSVKCEVRSVLWYVQCAVFSVQCAVPLVKCEGSHVP